MSRERLLSEYVKWQDYFGPDVVGLNDGSVFMMIGVDGLPFETTEDGIINNRHERLEAALRDGAQDGLIYGFLQCRGTADPSIYPSGKFVTTFAEQLDRRYFEKLFGTRSMWLNQTFLYVQMSPRKFGGKMLNRMVPSFRGKHAEPPRVRIDRLKRIVSVLCEHLKPYHPRILGVVRRPAGLFSEIAEAIAFAMTGHWRSVPLTTSGAASVFSEVFIVGPEAFEIRMPHASAFGACLNMHDFPAQTMPGMFDRFLATSYRHTLYHGFRCLPSVDGQALLVRKQNTYRSSGDRALSQVSELTQAANDVAANRMMMGDHAFALTLFVDNPDNLPGAVLQAWGDLSSAAVKVERENLALEAVLFSLIPGNFDLRGREAGISSRNFAAFACLHNFPSGERKGFWGGPIGMVRTSGGTPRLLHLHHDGVGNCFISGAVGSGKSTFIGWLICQAERTGAQIVLWDKDRGLEALVRALNGTYLTLVNTPGIGSGIAPLKRLTNSPEDLAFLAVLIRACIATPQHYDLTPEEDRRLAIGLRQVMRLPPEDRWMEDVRAFLGTSRDGAGARLEKFCWGQERGWVIDCPKDIVELDGRVIGFDQTDILDDPIASGAVITTLFHYTGKLVDGRRLLFLLDEVWNALLVEAFHAEIRNGLKTWRKYNSPILMGTQDVGDGLNSPIGDAIRGQTPTHFAFADPVAAWKDYGPTGIKATPLEFDIVQKLPKGTGHFLLRQGGQSQVLQADLSGMSEVAVISGTRRGVDAIKMARQRTDDAGGSVFVEAYHRAMEELAA